MSPIHSLSDSLINKIAAGEVVERPASVVKELVENALDAGATRIEVELVDGGKKSILVRDNGQGIAPDQLGLAVARHSTSKISKLEDLFQIQTLGFRGEALASIASISKLRLISKKTKSNVSAREIYLEGGSVVSKNDVGHPEGTSVLVKYLFYKTPARLKFLKGGETELNHISDYVTKAALANPHIALSLSHREKKIIKTYEGSDLTHRVVDLFGREVAEASYDLRGGLDGLEICGRVGHPQISRSNSRHLFLFVNGRPVRDKVLHHAIIEAYRDLLMRGRYPFVILFLKVPCEMVDVNVHPAKNEVRFFKLIDHPSCCL